MHGVTDNFGDLLAGKLDKAIVLGLAGSLVARDADTKNLAKLTKEKSTDDPTNLTDLFKTSHHLSSVIIEFD